MKNQKVALVTGGANRVGAEICRALAKAGFSVVIHYRNSMREAESLALELRTIGVESETLQAGFLDDTKWDDLMSETPLRSRVRLIVNNASTFAFDTIENMRRVNLKRNFRVNLFEPIMLLQWLKSVSEIGIDSQVINILDQKVENTNPDFFTYTCSKVALWAAMDTLAIAAAPLVRVNSISPGLLLPSGDQSAEQFESVHGNTPLARGATPKDVAEAACFLALSTNLTGVNIRVDAGQRLVRSQRDVMFTPL